MEDDLLCVALLSFLPNIGARFWRPRVVLIFGQANVLWMVDSLWQDVCLLMVVIFGFPMLASTRAT